MKKLFLTLLVVILGAAGCSGADSTSATPEEAVPDAAEVEVDGDLGDTVEQPTEDQPSATDAATAPNAACGFDTAVHDGEFIEVEQVASSPRQDVPSALNNSLNLDFPEPLIDVSRILSGGPPPDGIPPVDRPRFIPANQIDWLQCNAPVLALEINGESRAYPLQIMTWHEIVNDSFGDVPVTVSFCPLCNSAVAYDRRVGDLVLDFGTSGRLFNSSLVMYDRQTESLWTHFDGKAAVGMLTGEELELFPIQTIAWETFVAANPDALVLSRETGHNRQYGANPYPGYDNAGESPFLFDGSVDESQLTAKTRVVAIRDGDESVVIPLDELAAQGVIATEIGGRPITVWHEPGVASGLDTAVIAEGRDIGAVGVYDSVVDGDILAFSRTQSGEIQDESGNSWNIQGEATSGPLRGTKLSPIEHLDTFWFAIAAFSPDSEIVTG